MILPLEPEAMSSGEELPRAWWEQALRLVLGFGLIFAVVSVAGLCFRDTLSTLGRSFVDRFGLGGIVVGTFLADGLHFPVPPQFYMWTGIAGGQARALVLAGALLGSELGGLAAFSLARRAGRLESFAARMAGPQRLLSRYVGRRGYPGLALVAILPFSYCLLCMTAGALRMPYRAFGVIAAMRVPRILLSYALIALAW